MYENETYEVILERMLDRVSDQLDKRPSSLIYDTHSSTAIELQILYIELEYLIKNSYGDTAAREFLVMLCKDRGITPESATNAVLKGEFTPTDIDVTGQRFNIGSLNYVVTEQIAPGQYQVMCETAGVIGNQYLGQMIPMEYIDGLETATLTEVLVPGEDEEETEALRQRYFDSFNEQAFGGNRAAYLEAVRKIDGVGDVKVTRVWNGDIRPAEMIPGIKVQTWYNSIKDTLDTEVKAWLETVYEAAKEKKLTVGGTVLVTVVNSLDYGEASSVLLESIQTELDPVQNAGEGYGLAPIGHVVSVKSAETVAVYVTTTVTFEEGSNWTNTKTAIEEVIKAYLLELRQEWAESSYLIVRVSQLETRILGVKGVIDITNTKINGSAENLSLGEYQVPTFGGVSG
ncbi:baseplate J/gp47 family protein [Candidatus Acetatifactor stercoripullorum]|uniref:baseplate J/gp47 family protein n=1 Tax=Candidatus Acetatifactor stercoripullorum TaxID=2838414 RepID=UPI00298E9BE8|nr:baseplate J/gp47 family protein [Candidatus Acetatifactor stercoripullorum]